MKKISRYILIGFVLVSILSIIFSLMGRPEKLEKEIVYTDYDISGLYNNRYDEKTFYYDYYVNEDLIYAIANEKTLEVDHENREIEDKKQLGLIVYNMESNSIEKRIDLKDSIMITDLIGVNDDIYISYHYKDDNILDKKYYIGKIREDILEILEEIDGRNSEGADLIKLGNRPLCLFQNDYNSNYILKDLENKEEVVIKENNIIDFNYDDEVIVFYTGVADRRNVILIDKDLNTIGEDSLRILEEEFNLSNIPFPKELLYQNGKLIYTYHEKRTPITIGEYYIESYDIATGERKRIKSDLDIYKYKDKLLGIDEDIYQIDIENNKLYSLMNLGKSISIVPKIISDDFGVLLDHQRVFRKFK